MILQWKRKMSWGCTQSEHFRKSFSIQNIATLKAQEWLQPNHSWKELSVATEYFCLLAACPYGHLDVGTVRTLIRAAEESFTQRESNVPTGSEISHKIATMVSSAQKMQLSYPITLPAIIASYCFPVSKWAMLHQALLRCQWTK